MYSLFMNSLKSLTDQINSKPGILSIWTVETDDDQGYSFNVDLPNSATIPSFFDSRMVFQVKPAEPLQIVTKIPQAKKAQIKIENWDASEIEIRLEKIKNIIVENQWAIAGLEAHFQGTTREFQQRWSVEPLVRIIDDLLMNLEKVSVVAPIGLIGAITPRTNSFFEIGWRVLYSLFHKDCLLVKPATETALTGLIWQEILRDCDIPSGLVGFVYGPGASVGKLLMDHPGVRNISFSGGYDSLKTYSLSLEKKYQFFFNGKNAMCVLSDFDFKTNMNRLARIFVEHNGRGVFSSSRLFVIDSTEKEFKQALALCLASIPMLMSIDDEFGYLPLRAAEKIKMAEIRHRFESEGAKFLYENENFLFYSDLPNCSELFQENLELPVFNLTGVKYSHEMLKWLNNSSFGHSVIIFGPEEKAKKLSMKSEVGKVIFNPEPLENEWVIPVKMSGFGDLSFSIPNSFYSYVKS